jgi:hypothetical protein
VAKTPLEERQVQIPMLLRIPTLLRIQVPHKIHLAQEETNLRVEIHQPVATRRAIKRSSSPFIAKLR